MDLFPVTPTTDEDCRKYRYDVQHNSTVAQPTSAAVFDDEYFSEDDDDTNDDDDDDDDDDGDKPSWLDLQQPIYFPKRYGLDARGDADDVLSGYYHVTQSSSAENNRVTTNSSNHKRQLTDMPYFDESDGEGGCELLGAGGRVLNTITEEDEILEYLDCDRPETKSDDGEWLSCIGDLRSMPKLCENEDTSWGDVQDDGQLVNSNGSAVFDWKHVDDERLKVTLTTESGALVTQFEGRPSSTTSSFWQGLNATMRKIRRQSSDDDDDVKNSYCDQVNNDNDDIEGGRSSCYQVDTKDAKSSADVNSSCDNSNDFVDKNVNCDPVDNYNDAVEDERSSCDQVDTNDIKINDVENSSWNPVERDDRNDFDDEKVNCDPVVHGNDEGRRSSCNQVDNDSNNIDNGNSSCDQIDNCASSYSDDKAMKSKNVIKRHNREWTINSWYENSPVCHSTPTFSIRTNKLIELGGERSTDASLSCTGALLNGTDSSVPKFASGIVMITEAAVVCRITPPINSSRQLGRLDKPLSLPQNSNSFSTSTEHRPQFLLVDIDIDEHSSSSSDSHSPSSNSDLLEDSGKIQSERDQLYQRISDAKPIAPAPPIDDDQWNAEVALRPFRSRRSSAVSLPDYKYDVIGCTPTIPFDTRSSRSATDDRLHRARSMMTLSHRLSVTSPPINDDDHVLFAQRKVVASVDERSKSMSDLTTEHELYLFEMPSIDALSGPMFERDAVPSSSKNVRLSGTDLWLQQSLERLDLPSWCRNSPRVHQEIVTLKHAKSWSTLWALKSPTNSTPHTRMSLVGSKPSSGRTSSVVAPTSYERVIKPRHSDDDASKSPMGGEKQVTTTFRLPSETLRMKWKSPYSPVEIKSFEEMAATKCSDVPLEPVCDIQPSPLHSNAVSSLDERNAITDKPLTTVESCVTDIKEVMNASSVMWTAHETVVEKDEPLVREIVRDDSIVVGEFVNLSIKEKHHPIMCTVTGSPEHTTNVDLNQESRSEQSRASSKNKVSCHKNDCKRTLVVNENNNCFQNDSHVMQAREIYVETMKNDVIPCTALIMEIVTSSHSVQSEASRSGLSSAEESTKNELMHRPWYDDGNTRLKNHQSITEIGQFRELENKSCNANDILNNSKTVEDVQSEIIKSISSDVILEHDRVRHSVVMVQEMEFNSSREMISANIDPERHNCHCQSNLNDSKSDNEGKCREKESDPIGLTSMKLNKHDVTALGKHGSFRRHFAIDLEDEVINCQNEEHESDQKDKEMDKLTLASCGPEQASLVSWAIVKEVTASQIPIDTLLQRPVKVSRVEPRTKTRRHRKAAMITSTSQIKETVIGSSVITDSNGMNCERSAERNGSNNGIHYVRPRAVSSPKLNSRTSNVGIEIDRFSVDCVHENALKNQRNLHEVLVSQGLNALTSSAPVESHNDGKQTVTYQTDSGAKKVKNKKKKHMDTSIRSYLPQPMEAEVTHKAAISTFDVRNGSNSREQKIKRRSAEASIKPDDMSPLSLSSSRVEQPFIEDGEVRRRRRLRGVKRNDEMPAAIESSRERVTYNEHTVIRLLFPKQALQRRRRVVDQNAGENKKPVNETQVLNVSSGSIDTTQADIIGSGLLYGVQWHSSSAGSCCSLVQIDDRRPSKSDSQLLSSPTAGDEKTLTLSFQVASFFGRKTDQREQKPVMVKPSHNVVDQNVRPDNHRRRFRSIENVNQAKPEVLSESVDIWSDKKRQRKITKISSKQRESHRSRLAEDSNTEGNGTPPTGSEQHVTDLHQKLLENRIKRFKRKSTDRKGSDHGVKIDDDVTFERDLHHAMRTLRLAWSVSPTSSSTSSETRHRHPNTSFEHRVDKSTTGSSDSIDHHKKLSTLCGRILRRARDIPHLSRTLADIAVYGFRSADGDRRGCVLMTFDNVDDAECFAAGAGDYCRQVFYVGVDELRGACCASSSMLSDIESLCSDYEPQTRYIVCVAVVNMQRTVGCVRGARLRLPECHVEDSTTRLRTIVD